MNFGATRTAGDYRVDEVTSALQKSIRRGLEFDAVFWAMELESVYPNYVWKRLRVIYHEDISIADPDALLYLQACRRDHDDFVAAGTWEQFPLINAVLRLCRAKKCRMASELYTLVYENADLHLEVPDYAVDMHTERGRALGRNFKHFAEVGSFEANSVPSPYTERAFAAIREGRDKLRSWVKGRESAIRDKRKPAAEPEQDKQTTLF